MTLGQAATYQCRTQLLVQKTLKHGLSFYFEYQGCGPEARCTSTWGDEGICPDYESEKQVRSATAAVKTV